MRAAAGTSSGQSRDFSGLSTSPGFGGGSASVLPQGLAASIGMNSSSSMSDPLGWMGPSDTRNTGKYTWSLNGVSQSKSSCKTKHCSNTLCGTVTTDWPVPCLACTFLQAREVQSAGAAAMQGSQQQGRMSSSKIHHGRILC